MMAGVKLVAAPALREGDTIAVVAPAGPVPMDRLAPGIEMLRTRFKVIVSEDIARRDGFLAGDDARRAEEFNAALRNPEVRAIWAARGGYGCSRIVSSLDEAAMGKDPKHIVGFSDLTVLLCWAASLGLQSIHGPVLTQLGELARDDREWVVDLLMGNKRDAMFAEGLATDLELEAPVLGGNLSLLAHLCGTERAPNYSDAICLLEDVGERPYAIDRYLSQLLMQSAASGLRAAHCVLLGDFARCVEESDASQEVMATITARLRMAGLPSALGLPFGHGDRNRAFAFGGQATIEHGCLRLH